MNELQTSRSEKIASRIMRLLAIVGLVAVLVLATWTVVQGSRFLPNVSENVASAVSAVRSVFTTAPADSLVFDFENRTLVVEEPANIIWTSTGEGVSKPFTFMYTCGTDASLQVKENDTWNDLACDTSLKVESDNITILPSNTLTRFADVTLSITSGVLNDTTVVTIVNTEIDNTISSTDERVVITTPTEQDTPSEVPAVTTPVVTTTPTPATPVTPKPQQTPTTPAVTTTTVVPLYSGLPVDLVLTIEETGVLVKVAGENTFFPISPIPDNKVAAVTFSVTNRGGTASKPWIFKAELPVEGDNNYEYTSPVQNSLSSGMQVTYTLGFDEILQSSKGTIKIKIIPTDATDKTSNNEDSVVINIDRK